MNDLLTPKDFVKVGYLGGLHGYEGNLRLSIEDQIIEEFNQQIRFLYLIDRGMYVPRFISTWDPAQSLVSFERFESREQARSLTDQDVFLRKRDVPEAMDVEGDHIFWNVLGGFRIWDVETDTAVGSIDAIEEYPGGWMAIVSQTGRSESILIPLAEPLIDRIDEENQVLYMVLPEGLVGL